MYQYRPLDEELIKASKRLNEWNDCTVKAFAKVFNTTYEKAHSHLKNACSRQNKCGIHSSKVLPQSLKKTKHKVGPYTTANRIQLKKFCEKHPKGRYYVALCGHAIAVIDGVVYDHSDRPRRQVTWAMRVYLEGEV